MTIYFESDNSNHSHDIYLYIVELLENKVKDKSIVNKLSIELTINYN